MGKGGCQTSIAADLGQLDAAAPGSSVLGFGAIISALQLITSSKWAETQIDPRSGEKAERSGEPSTVRPVHDCLKDGKIPWDVVRRHNHANSCWMVVRNKVYDVTNFASQHPGGSAILAYGGRDASDVFAAFHASRTWSRLKQFYIGDVEDAEPDPMLVSFRSLRASMVRQGLFLSSKSFYAWKTLSLLGMYFTVATILAHARDTWAGCLAAAFTLALCWQQTGWLSHDFLHHQVFKNRVANTVCGYVAGNVLQGFSVDWWKNKHNKHHAVPNECSEHAEAVDPDIDTLPLLAWHEDMLKNVSPSMSSILRYQHHIFFPILCFARFAWAQQSLTHARLLARMSWRGVAETALLLLHYGIFLGLPFTVLSPVKAVAFFVIAQVLAGFMLAIVFVQSHNGMEVYMDPKDFVSAQIVSTRNIDSTMWMDWFTGGLNFQIEHHLFPTLPRHNLPLAKDMVMRFCKEHGFTYESCGMDTGTYRVLSRLADIAAKVV